MFRIRRDHARPDIVTLDGSWFSLSTDHELIWLADAETVPERD
jgi:hypothetical protein